jgi:PAS domain S-box-containing protein
MYTLLADDRVTALLRAEAGPDHRSEPLSGRSELECAALLQALPNAVYTTDATGLITYYNEAAVELWGCRPELGSSAWCGSWRLYWPDGRPMAHDECPMAIALKEKRPISGAEAIAERPDGTRVPFIAYPAPLWDVTGRLCGGINTLVDIGERKKAEYFSRWLSAIVESSDEAIVSKNLEGIVTSWNAGAEHLLGYSADEIIGKPIQLVVPPELWDEERQIIGHIRRGERVAPFETRRRRKDGSLVDVWLTVSPIRSGDGRIVGASTIARDITERRQAEAKQRLLVKEMCHRIKNLLTLASGVVSLNARSAATPRDLADSVRARLGALARAQALTLPDLGENELRTDQRPTTLTELVRTILEIYIDEDHASAVIRGPEVPIRGAAVTSVALFLHEMMTNAAKYGALSSDDGSVDVSWTVRDGELLLAWRERGGPVVKGPPESEGFGALLTRLTVTGQLDGKIAHEWELEGLTVHLTVPLERLTR